MGVFITKTLPSGRPASDERSTRTGFWKIRKIYAGDYPDPKVSSPLARPDLRVRPGMWLVAIDGRQFQVDASYLGDDSLLNMILDNESYLAHTRIADARRGLLDVSIGGKYRKLEVLDELAAATAHAAGKDHQGRFVLEAPMPGLVVALRVKPGDTVQAGQPLVVMEAMKMQNELLSETTGVVREVRVRLEQAVESGTELVVIESS